jgi:pyridoxal phosphate enzyme (YggS family)
LLQEINKQAEKNEPVTKCLLQIKIAEEDSKYGLSEAEAISLLNAPEIKELQHVSIIGLMGMATFTEDTEQLTYEFQNLKKFFDAHKNNFHFTTLSMGMSSDYALAIENGSTMVRVGSAIFGERNY